MDTFSVYLFFERKRRKTFFSQTNARGFVSKQDENNTASQG